MRNNVRTLYPPIRGDLATGGGGGGGGGNGNIQKTTMPTATLGEKDKIYQYVGSTTNEFTNGYFYKCIEHTETVNNEITVTYAWVQIDTQPESGLVLTDVETVTADGTKTYKQLLHSFSNISALLTSNDIYVLCYNDGNVEGFEYYMPMVSRNTTTLRFMCNVPVWGGSSMTGRLVSGAISADIDFCTCINGNTDVTIQTPAVGVKFTLKKYS